MKYEHLKWSYRSGCWLLIEDDKDTSPQGAGAENPERVTETNATLTFTTDIIDKQYRSYIWNDGKMQALVTTDGALLASLFLLAQLFATGRSSDYVALLPAFGFLLASFVVCISHAIPKIDSGVGNENNLRTMVGIRGADKRNPRKKEEYHAKICKLDIDEMVRMNCWQIAGMCKNNLRSHKMIRRAVWLTIAGVLFLVPAVPILVHSHIHSKTPAISNANTRIQPSIKSQMKPAVPECNAASDRPAVSGITKQLDARTKISTRNPKATRSK